MADRTVLVCNTLAKHFTSSSPIRLPLRSSTRSDYIIYEI